MKVYVGTYAKYNNGSLGGAWVDLDKYISYAAFVAECRSIHKDEADPEFMVQDAERDGEDWQEGLSGESLRDYEDYWTLKAEFAAKPAPSVTVTENTEKNGIEIRFAEKPAPSVIADLKAQRWRWSRFGGCWYNFANDENRAFAAAVAGGADIPAASATPAAKSAAVSPFKAAVKAMEDAAKKSLAEYRAWLEADPKRVARLWKHDVDGHMKGLVGVVRLDSGAWLTFDKIDIETHFCCSENDRGQGGEDYGTIAFAEKCCDGFRSEVGFKLHNNYKSAYNEGHGDIYACYPLYKRENWRWATNEAGMQWPVTIEAINRFGQSQYKSVTEFSEREWKAVRRMEAWRIISLRRRVNAYWKRFGASKLRTWTYWSEA